MFLLMSPINVLIGADNGPATITPMKPSPGDVIRIEYNTASKAANLKNVKGITAEVLLLQDKEVPNLVEIPLRRSGKVWNGIFKLEGKKNKALLFKFVSGEMSDDNGHNVWTRMVYGTDSREVEGAHLSLAQVYFLGEYVGFRKPKNVDSAIQELKLERTMYPENVTAAAFSWSLDLQASPGLATRTKILDELNMMLEQHKDSEEDAALFVEFLDRLNKSAIADSLRRYWIENNPRGKLAEVRQLNEVGAQRNVLRRAILLEQFLQDFPQHGESKRNLEQTLIESYATARNFEKAGFLMRQLEPPSSTLLNSLAWEIIQGGEDGPMLDSAVAWARYGIDVIKSGKDSKPPYLSKEEWKKSQKENLGLLFDTYGFGLSRFGRKKDAERAYEQAVKLTDGKQADIDERYCEMCLLNRSYQKVLTIAPNFIANGMMSDTLLADYKMAYVAVKGSAKGFDAVVANQRLIAKEAARMVLIKSRMNEPAPDFSLRRIDGTLMNLAALRGKVVVIDFWATWCGPCQVSLPYLQKLYEQFSNNPNVVILGINTWENVTGDERERIVKKFIADHAYTFPVVYDEGVVNEYGVQAIPTKFVIDKKGRIQFKSEGFFDGRKMMDELALQIDLLLSDDFYSYK